MDFPTTSSSEKALIFCLKFYVFFHSKTCEPAFKVKGSGWSKRGKGLTWPACPKPTSLELTASTSRQSVDCHSVAPKIYLGEDRLRFSRGNSKKKTDTKWFDKKNFFHEKTNSKKNNLMIFFSQEMRSIQRRKTEFYSKLPSSTLGH